MVVKNFQPSSANEAHEAELEKLRQYLALCIEKGVELSAEELSTIEEILNAVPPDIEAELEKCRYNVKHFINSYIYTFDPRLQQSTRLRLFPHQEELVNWLEGLQRNEESGCVEKSRDSGASVVACAYAVHGLLFRPYSQYSFGSRKEDLVDKIGDMNCLFEKIRFMIGKIPQWFLRACAPDFNPSKHCKQKLVLNPSNGASITGESGDGIGRGGRATVYFVDESAFIDHPDLMDAALSQTTRVRVDISTPNGINNNFYKRKQLCKTIQLHWINDPRKNKWEEYDKSGKIVDRGHPNAPIPSSVVRPEYDRKGRKVVYPWYEKTRMQAEFQNDPAKLAQEVDIDYIGSGHPRFNRAFLTEVHQRMWNGVEYLADWEPELIETTRNSSWAGDVTIFRHPQEGRQYMLVADTARGLTENGSADFSVAHVYDLYDAEQVCHYRGQMVEYDFAIDLQILAKTYNNAIIVVEIPGPGETVISQLVNTIRYANLYSYWDDDGLGGTKVKRYGFPRTSLTKPEADADLAGMLDDWSKGMPSILIRHHNTIAELMTYSRLKGQRTGAEGGGHDDEVSCCTMFATLWNAYNTRQNRTLNRKPYRSRLISRR